MQGRRVENVSAVWDGMPGVYSLSEDRTVLWVKVPTGTALRLPVQEGAQHPTETVWGFTEHEDGSITVEPSINLHASPGIGPWHGFLRRGVWSGA